MIELKGKDAKDLAPVLPTGTAHVLKTIERLQTITGAPVDKPLVLPYGPNAAAPKSAWGSSLQYEWVDQK